MTIAADQVLLYAASTGDLEKARGVAAALDLPSTSIQNDFSTIWGHVQSGNYLVIAVGGAALDSLYYNPCGWSNPSNDAGGQTPFSIASAPCDTLPGANYFINAAGSTSADTLYLTAAYAYYAVNGEYPDEFNSPPTPESPSSVCESSFSSDVACPCSGGSTGGGGLMNGVDTTADLSSEASCLAGSYGFVLRYLGGPCYPGTVLTSSEAQTLSNAGLYIGSLYSGANDSPNAQCGTQTSAQGTTDGQSAVSLAQGVGQPSGTAIYLDIEADQENDNYLTYAQAWASAVSEGGYTPGVYSSPAQIETIYGESWGGSNLLYYVASWEYSSEQTPPPAPSSELSYAQMWQYAGNATACNVSVDIDSAENTTGLWQL